MAALSLRPRQQQCPHMSVALRLPESCPEGRSNLDRISCTSSSFLDISVSCINSCKRLLPLDQTKGSDRKLSNPTTAEQKWILTGLATGASTREISNSIKTALPSLFWGHREIRPMGRLSAVTPGRMNHPRLAALCQQLSPCHIWKWMSSIWRCQIHMGTSSSIVREEYQVNYHVQTSTKQILTTKQVENDDSWYFQGNQSPGTGTHLPSDVNLSSQQALPALTCPPLVQSSNEITQHSNRDFLGSMMVPIPAATLRYNPNSSLQALNRVPTQSRRTGRRRRSLGRASGKAPSISMTSTKLSSRKPLNPQKGSPAVPNLARGSKEHGGTSSQPTASSLGCSPVLATTSTQTAVMREAIAAIQESIKPFSNFSRRKATHLIKEIAKLADQLDELALEEEQFGTLISSDDEIAQPSTASSSQNSLSNSKVLEIESETENTSVSSSSLQPVVESQDLASVEDEQHKPVHPTCLQCGIKDLYYCTREGCKYSTHSFAEWKRHEESQKHSQQERFMCTECLQTPPPVNENGDPVCEFCHISFPGLGTNLTAHHLQCQSAQQSSTTYGRKDRLIAHLRSHPGLINVSHVAAAGKYTVNRKWPRQCGFCGVTFKAWDERMDHIAAHFQDGLDMSSWKLPLPRPKDFRPRFKPQPKDGDDSDDDMDDNDSHPSLYRTGFQHEPGSTNSSQKKNSTESQRRSGTSCQESNRQRHGEAPVDHDHEADRIGTQDSDHLEITIRKDPWQGRQGAPRRPKLSAAIKRYLSDVEEPVHIRLSPRSPWPSREPPIQNTTVKDTKIDSLIECSGKILVTTRKQDLGEALGTLSSKAVQSVDPIQPHQHLSHHEQMHKMSAHYVDIQQTYATAQFIDFPIAPKTNGTKPRLGKDEVHILEQEFKKNHKPTTQTKRQFAEDMGVDLTRINVCFQPICKASTNGVQNWFQNRRAKWKLEKQESHKAEQLQAGLGPYSEPLPPLHSSSKIAFIDLNSVHAITGGSRSSSTTLSATSQTSSKHRGAPSTLVSASDEYPVRIPPEKLQKALQLYNAFKQEMFVQNSPSTNSDFYLVAPRPSTFHSIVTGTPFTKRVASISESAYDGVTDCCSVVSFDQSPLSALKLTSFDGKKVRTRKRLTPTARAEAALVRYLGACQKCRSRRVPVSNIFLLVIDLGFDLTEISAV